MSLLWLEKIFGREPQSPAIPVLVPLRLLHRTHLVTISLLGSVAWTTAQVQPVVSLLCVVLLGVCVLRFRRDREKEVSRITFDSSQNSQSPADVTSRSVENAVGRRAKQLAPPKENVEIAFSEPTQSRFASIQLSVTTNQSVAEFVSNIVANMGRDIGLNQFGKTWVVTDIGGNTILDGPDYQKALAATGITGGMKLVVARKN